MQVMNRTNLTDSIAGDVELVTKNLESLRCGLDLTTRISCRRPRGCIIALATISVLSSTCRRNVAVTCVDESQALV